MPVANTSNQYLDSMPVAKPSGVNTRYTMMVKRIDYAKRAPFRTLPETKPEAEKVK